jgi:hypothetical protein
MTCVSIIWRKDSEKRKTDEFDKPETIAAIVSALQELGHRTDRIGHIRFADRPVGP